MKKRILPFILSMGIICLGSVGCSNSTIDTAKVRAAFSSVQGDARGQLDAALAAIDSSNYVAAVQPLVKISYELKMNNDQREILKDTLKKVRAKAGRQR